MRQGTHQTQQANTVTSLSQFIVITVRQVSRRQWRLWLVGMLLLILLLLGIASFAFPGLLSQQVNSESYQLNLELAVRSLVGLVLLFGIYVIHQQWQIGRMDRMVLGALGEIKERTAQVYRLVGRDELTDLYSRKLGEQRLAEEMSRSKRQGKPLAVVRLGLEGLGQIDEGLGSGSSGCVIRLFADHLRARLRAIDVPIRLDQGEFLVLLPECKSVEVENVLNRLNRMTFKFGEGQRTEVVAGWSNYVEGEAAQTLIMRAESALHSNKKHGAGTPPPVKVSVSSNGSKTCADDRIAKLKPRERQVFELLARGKTNKDVANELDISVRTAESYRKSIMSQLDVHSGPELVLYAVENGIISRS